MLSWWLGKSAEGGRVEQDELEPPETPAPVFAARALKSAIFGTPGLPNDDTVYDDGEESPSEIVAAKESKRLLPRSLSPTKPQGILLTPGTAAARRKTVSFGNEVKDEDDGKTGDKGDGRIPLDWASKMGDSSKKRTKTTLTQTLENARTGKSPDMKSEPNRSQPDTSDFRPKTRGKENLAEEKPDDQKPTASRTTSRRASKSEQSNQDLVREVTIPNLCEGDATVDLNMPNSQSGKFWKAEYEQYHEEAKKEMEKLVGYKSLAKSFAKIKDKEAALLAEKLEEEQRKVVAMEDKVSQLSARVAAAGMTQNDEDSPELMKELARQTALAVQYKAQVEEFRSALEGNGSKPRTSKTDEEKPTTQSQIDKALRETSRELKRAREQIKEMASLREEMDQLRQTLASAEKSNAKLQAQNTKITQELLHADMRFENHLEKCERKQKSSDEHRQRKEDAFINLQKDYDNLKEQAKSQRRDAEQLLRKKHDQAVELRKELSALRNSSSSAYELQELLSKRTSEHEATVAEYKKQIDEMKGGARHTVEDVDHAREKDGRSVKYTSSAPSRTALPSEVSQPRESHIPIPSQSISRPSKAVAPTKLMRSETPTDSSRPKSPYFVLSEIVNSASVDAVPPRSFGPVQHTPQIKLTPLASKFSNLSLESPNMELPSPEPSPLLFSTNRAIHERNCHASPRPSMFNIASSPPKAAMIRSRGSDEITRLRSTNDLTTRRYTNIASSRLSSMDGSKARATLPPERVAAAKARLQQKQLEKKKSQAFGPDKENIQI